MSNPKLKDSQVEAKSESSLAQQQQQQQQEQEQEQQQQEQQKQVSAPGSVQDFSYFVKIIESLQKTIENLNARLETFEAFEAERLRLRLISDDVSKHKMVGSPIVKTHVKIVHEKEKNNG